MTDQAQKPRRSRKGIGGRPTTFPQGEAAKALCERVIELGSQGMSDCEISREIDVPRGTMQSWAERHLEFSAALTRAREASQAWWEQAGREHIKDKNFNAQLWLKTMASRFRQDYAERQTIEHTGADGGPIRYEKASEEELDRRLAELTQKLESDRPAPSSESVH